MPSEICYVSKVNAKKSVAPQHVRRMCALFALLATALLASWQAATVHFNYGGNWSGLFCTGSMGHGIPPAIQFEKTYLFPNSYGYDGQFYHLIAHDPILQRGFASFCDNPRYRYQRILVPGLAFLVALGQDAHIDAAYLVLIWLWIFLGAYWLGRFAVLRGYPAWFGLAFALAPSVLVSVDRLTVDVALAACCVGFVLFIAEESDLKLYAVLAAVPLARESGVFLLAAWCIWLAVQRQWRRALIFTTALIPAACWFLYVRLHTPPDDVHRLLWLPFAGIVTRVLNPYAYPFGGGVRILALGLDLLALAGIAGAVGWAIYRAMRRTWQPAAIALYLFALLAITLEGGDLWAEVYGFGRTLTPLVLLAALDGLTVGTVAPSLAMLAIDPRIGLQLAVQILGVVRGLIHTP